MPSEKCTLYSGEKCTVTLEPCDFNGENYKECLRYRLSFIRPQAIQFR